MEERAQIGEIASSVLWTPGRLLKRAFFEAPPELVAPRLLGKVLVHRTGSGRRAKLLAGRIVEVEAYLGPHNDPPDPAAHTYRGPSPRNSIMFGPAGHAYVYFIYGRYFCMNVSCETEGRGSGILLRALEPLGGPSDKGLAQMARNRGLTLGEVDSGKIARQIACGPGRLCEALDITRQKHNGLDLTDPASPLQMLDDGYPVTEVMVTARIGIRHAADWPLRFALPGHNCVSGPKSLTGKRVRIG
jgi:DNA-3-methyladenine glycosylase